MKYKSSLLIITVLKRYIGNKDFQLITQNINIKNNDKEADILIIKCKNWFLENLGKYKINNFTGVGNPIEEISELPSIDHQNN